MDDGERCGADSARRRPGGRGRLPPSVPKRGEEEEGRGRGAVDGEAPRRGGLPERSATGGGLRARFGGGDGGAEAAFVLGRELRETPLARVAALVPGRPLCGLFGGPLGRARPAAAGARLLGGRARRGGRRRRGEDDPRGGRAEREGQEDEEPGPSAHPTGHAPPPAERRVERVRLAVRAQAARSYGSSGPVQISEPARRGGEVSAPPAIRELPRRTRGRPRRAGRGAVPPAPRTGPS